MKPRLLSLVPLLATGVLAVAGCGGTSEVKCAPGASAPPGKQCETDAEHPLFGESLRQEAEKKARTKRAIREAERALSAGASVDEVAELADLFQGNGGTEGRRSQSVFERKSRKAATAAEKAKALRDTEAAEGG